MIEFRHLKHFLAVVDHGGVRQAGRAIHLSASAITRSIQMLEEHYGVELLSRDKHRTELTAFGVELARDARALVAGFQGIDEKLKQVTSLETGTLRLGIGPSASGILIPVVAARMARDHPRVQLEIFQHDATLILDRLVAHELDVGVGHDRPFRNRGGFEVVPLYGDTVEWWVRREHPLAGRPSLTPSDLVAFPIVSQFLPEYFQSWLESVGLEAAAGNGGQRLTHGLQCTDYHILTRMALDSDAVLICPRQTMLHCGLSDAFVNLPLPTMPPAVVALALPRFPSPSPLAMRVVSLLRDAARDMTGPAE